MHSIPLLSSDFFQRSTLAVAPDLLGLFICRRMLDGRIIKGMIIEVEAYTENDPACHAFRGKTPRCAVMFGPGGYAYVYFIYGMYYCFNVVTEVEGVAGAVLVRALELKDADGPGKLCRLLEISKEQNGIDLLNRNGPLWLESPSEIKQIEIEHGPRIGLSQAKENPWRFVIAKHPQLSSPRTPTKKYR